jgi:anthranilate phosphoribosyltransferase
MARLSSLRRALGVRTVFNLLGPLTNPAAPPYAVIGAYDADAAARMARALAALPLRRAFVVHGACGWDEATPCGPFLLLDVEPGRVRRSVRDPLDAGYPRARPEDLLGADADHNAQRLCAVLDGERGPHRDAVALGAALVLEVTGTATSPGDAREAAEAALDAGLGRRLLDRLVALGRPAVPGTDRG